MKAIGSIYFMAVFMLFGACIEMNGQTFPPDDIPVNPPPRNPQSLTDAPAVRASYTADTLTVIITGYFGDMEVVIEDETSGTVQVTQTEYISWHGTVMADIHSLASGSYVLRIRLEDGDEYVGYFSK